jgi:hypothetical protein
MSETTDMLHSWIAADHARLHLIAEWPESARKETVLKAIRASIQSLMIGQEVASFTCAVCRAARTAVVLPRSPQLRPATRFHGLAA